MHVWTTTKPVNTEKLQKAISVLETLSDRRTRLILRTLKEHERTTFLELMICTRLNSEELELWLEQLCDTGAIKMEEADWQARFSVDEKRLSRIVACTRALARGSAFILGRYFREIPRK